MPQIFVTGRNSHVHIGRELGRGGEGSVYEVDGNPKLVAKLYHKKPDVKKQSKIAFMAATANDQLLRHTAWPQETLHQTRGGPTVGFLMPRIQSKSPIHMLYSPAHRRQDYPRATWEFLLVAARNTAAAFSTLHQYGHVLGDVNQGNVLVGTDGQVVLIDCDSFQINEKGNLHLCEVGVSHFTPPELQGLPSFDGVARTINHDNFGLALLLFHLLFGGRHPYSGVPLSKDVGEALETDIRALRFAYARDSISRSISPPPHSISLSTIPPAMGEMFEAAFTERGLKGLRPTSQHWVTSLDALRGRLRKCQVVGMHIYPDHLANCPWCSLESQGVVYFISIDAPIGISSAGFVLAQVWARIDAVPIAQPLLLPSLPTATPRPLPSGVVKPGNGAVAKLLVVIFTAVAIALVPKFFLLFLFFAWIAWASSNPTESQEYAQERSNRKVSLESAKKNFEEVAIKVKSFVGRDAFLLRKDELSKLRDEYKGLETKEKQEIDHLRATGEDRQKQQFLDKFFIDAATIPGVGAAKKAALRSFGIETAADVTWQKVHSVRGFGDVLTRAVVDWKKACERKFSFNPNLAVSDSDKNSIRAKFATRKRQIEVALNDGGGKLHRCHLGVGQVPAIHMKEFEQASLRLSQAKADCEVF